MNYVHDQNTFILVKFRLGEKECMNRDVGAYHISMIIFWSWDHDGE